MEIFLLFPESLKVPKKCFFNLKILNYSHICSGIFFKKKNIIIPVSMLEYMEQAKLVPITDFFEFSS